MPTGLLGFLLNQEGFVPSQRDLCSLLTAYSQPSPDFEILKRRQACLRLLAQSYRMHMVYESMPFEMRKGLVKASQLLERPFLRDALALALAKELPEEVIDKAASTLTTEDWEYLQFNGAFDAAAWEGHGGVKALLQRFA